MTIQGLLITAAIFGAGIFVGRRTVTTIRDFDEGETA